MNGRMFFILTPQSSEFIVLICKLEMIMIMPTCKAEMRIE